MGKPIMIQGTMSNAGKSLITAGLLRIFKQDGYSCAPFKSQNMALNSYITEDGCEIGRAQAMQAEAAGVEPSVLMNPILLKPVTDSGSQVIAFGKVVGNMSAAEYFRRKSEFIPGIVSAYKRLSSQYDIVVIEGAGSPVELNLKNGDIVNMGMAKIAESPVILVGDIDRGGVFAQLFGTLDLLENDERDMVKGLIVNKFRGDKNLFESGAEILRKRSGKPFLGVMPYVKCDIEDEDSLSEKLDKNYAPSAVKIAVIRLPRISNFTDFDVFAQYNGVSVEYMTDHRELETADMIIIPGTKNTIADMKWLRESGMEAAIKRSASRNVPVFGICGGYQMLGGEISDPYNMESGEKIRGMELLKTETIFDSKKTQIRTSGKFVVSGGIFSCLNGAHFEGYEIHMGITKNEGKFLLDRGGSYEGNVCGCYVHGIFDSPEVSERIIRKLFSLKGTDYQGGITDRKAYKDSQFDILADEIRKNIDIEKIYRIIEEGI